MSIVGRIDRPSEDEEYGPLQPKPEWPTQLLIPHSLAVNRHLILVGNSEFKRLLQLQSNRCLNSLAAADPFYHFQHTCVCVGVHACSHLLVELIDLHRILAE